MSKNFGYLAAAALGAVALLGATALPASAADTGDTTVTFTLAGGSLDITPAAGAALTDDAPGAASVSGSLGAVGVSVNHLYRDRGVGLHRGQLQLRGGHRLHRHGHPDFGGRYLDHRRRPRGRRHRGVREQHGELHPDAYRRPAGERTGR